MVADNGEKIKEAGPSTPVEILGLNNVPNAGEILMSTKNEKEARNIAETFINEGREKLLEATSEIRKSSADIPIIAVTAYAFTEDEKRILENGFNGYLSKPIKAQTLLQKIKEFLN